MLYLVSTPIGNLKDISERAIAALTAADYILCEDTRHTAKLLMHYAIKSPLKSYHQFNEAQKEESVIHDLKSGKIICLVSDAGTPGIADPGERLVKRCHEEGVNVSAIPGPSALITALALSGIPSIPFTFFGFLPKKPGELKEAIIEIIFSQHTTACFVPPHQLKSVLMSIAACDSKRTLCIARELTKQYEQLQRGTAKELLDAWQDEEVRGEIVLIISGNPKLTQEFWQQKSGADLVEELKSRYQLSQKEALSLAAKLQGIPKRELYADLLKLNMD